MIVGKFVRLHLRPSTRECHFLQKWRFHARRPAPADAGHLLSIAPCRGEFSLFGHFQKASFWMISLLACVGEGLFEVHFCYFSARSASQPTGVGWEALRLKLMFS